MNILCSSKTDAVGKVALIDIFTINSENLRHLFTSAYCPQDKDGHIPVAHQ